MIYCVLWEGPVNSQHSRSPRDSGGGSWQHFSPTAARGELSLPNPKSLNNRDLCRGSKRLFMQARAEPLLLLTKHLRAPGPSWCLVYGCSMPVLTVGPPRPGQQLCLQAMLCHFLLLKSFCVEIHQDFPNLRDNNLRNF